MPGFMPGIHGFFAKKAKPAGVIQPTPSAAIQPFSLIWLLQSDNRLLDFWTMVDTVLRERGVLP
jgi:hypothetical protein